MDGERSLRERILDGCGGDRLRRDLPKPSSPRDAFAFSWAGLTAFFAGFAAAFAVTQRDCQTPRRFNDYARLRARHDRRPSSRS